MVNCEEKGIESIKTIFELSYEIDNMYFILGFFTKESEARKHFDLVKRNRNYCQDGAEILQIREFEINKLEVDQLQSKRILIQHELGY